MSAAPCARCGDEMWVCEVHTDRPWNYGEGCGEQTCPFTDECPDACPFIDACHDGRPCEMAGMPCPDCNPDFPGPPMAEPGVSLTPNLLLSRWVGDA